MDVLSSVDPTQSGAPDALRPSFFELVAQEQLRDLLAPALRFVVATLAQRHPRALLRVANRFDEVYALAMFAVERHYLKTWGSSFAENFYGLRRRRRPGLSSSRTKGFSATPRASLARYETLRPREIRASLFLLVAAPYLKGKLHDAWERVGGGAQGALFDDERGWADETASQTRIERLRTLATYALRHGYPWASAGYQLWLLSYNIAYLFEKTPYWRPWLQALRVDIRRVGPGDYPPAPPLLPPDMPSPLRSPLQFALRLLQSSPYMAFEALKYALPLSIFAFKFLEWWYSPDNPRRRRGGGGSGAAAGALGGEDDTAPALGAPKVLLPHPKGCLYVKDPSWRAPGVATTRLPPVEDDEKRLTAQEGLLHNSCVICGAAPIVNPAMLPTGYAGCFACLHAALERVPRCPVTLVRVAEGDLRRVLG